MAKRRIQLKTSRAGMKLAAFRQAIADETAKVLMGPAQQIAVAVSQKFAPQPTEEQQILVQGTIIQPWSRRYGRSLSATSRTALARPSSGSDFAYGRFVKAQTGREVGTAAGGRFIKRGGNEKYIVEALADQTFHHISRRPMTTKAKVTARWGSWRNLANNTGFSYYQMVGRGRRTRQGILQKTKPFNKDWPRTADVGGSWIVVPRPRGGGFSPPLAPAPGVYASRMLKTVKPYRYSDRARRAVLKWMFARGRRTAEKRAAAAADMSVNRLRGGK